MSEKFDERKLKIETVENTIDDCYTNLAYAIVRQAVVDLRAAYRAEDFGNACAIEKWFRQGDGDFYSGCRGEAIIKMVRSQVKSEMFP